MAAARVLLRRWLRMRPLLLCVRSTSRWLLRACSAILALAAESSAWRWIVLIHVNSDERSQCALRWVRVIRQPPRVWQHIFGCPRAQNNCAALSAGPLRPRQKAGWHLPRNRPAIAAMAATRCC